MSDQPPLTPRPGMAGAVSTDSMASPRDLPWDLQRVQSGPLMSPSEMSPSASRAASPAKQRQRQRPDATPPAEGFADPRLPSAAKIRSVTPPPSPAAAALAPVTPTKSGVRAIPSGAMNGDSSPPPCAARAPTPPPSPQSVMALPPLRIDAPMLAGSTAAAASVASAARPDTPPPAATSPAEPGGSPLQRRGQGSFSAPPAGATTTPAAVHFGRPAAEGWELSNLYRHRMQVDGKEFPTVEHYVHYTKFEDDAPQVAERVRMAQTPGEARGIADAMKRHVAQEWEQQRRDDAVRRGLRAKFADENLRAVLVSTGRDTPLILDARKDSYWGGGADGSGVNRLGELLMEMREEIIDALPPSEAARLDDIAAHRAEQRRRRLQNLDDAAAEPVPDDEPEPEPEPIKRTWHTMLAGLCAGTVSRTLTAPLDRIKVLSQEGRIITFAQWHPTVQSLAESHRRKVSLRKVVDHIMADGGVRAFWRGNGVNCVKAGPELGLLFALRQVFIRALEVPEDARRKEARPAPEPVAPDDAVPSPASSDALLEEAAADVLAATAPGPQVSMVNVIRGSLNDTARNFLSSAAAGATAQCILYPLETAKTRMAVASSGEYSGLWDCLRQSYIRGGLRDFYKGLGANLMGIVPYRGLEVGSFYALERRLLDWRRTCIEQGYMEALPRGYSLDELSMAEVALVGGVSSILAQTVTYPLNLVRTRLQTQGVNGRPVQYRGMAHCFVTIVRANGPQGLFHGLTANYLKAVPASITTFMVVNKVQSILGREEGRRAAVARKRREALARGEASAH